MKFTRVWKIIMHTLCIHSGWRGEVNHAILYSIHTYFISLHTLAISPNTQWNEVRRRKGILENSPSETEKGKKSPCPFYDLTCLFTCVISSWIVRQEKVDRYAKIVGMRKFNKNSQEKKESGISLVWLSKDTHSH